MKKILTLLAVLLIGGCTDATQSKISSYGSPHEVECYQYDKLIYKGVSTGRISYDEGSIQKMSFEERDSKRLVEIVMGMSATCVTKVLAQ